MSDHHEDPLARARAKLGTVLRGKYRLDSVLGVGGMAAVYHATHRNHAELAIKVLHPELSHRLDVRQRFLREGYAANSVKHPGVVLVVDDDVAEDGSAFLVMELVRGLDVDKLCERAGGRLTVSATLSIAYQLLDVLGAAHANGVVHRDIKPANLFVTTDGRLKVLDFGIARARDVALGNASSTNTGMLLGTPAFMAPEQALARSSDIDAQTDLWAVGATMFRLLGGEMVHVGESAQEIVIRAATVPPRSLTSVIGDAPRSLVEVVDRALAFDKASRWPTATAMREAIGAVSVELLGQLPSSTMLVQPAEGLAAGPSAHDLAATAPTELPQDRPASAQTPSPGDSRSSTAQPVSSEGARDGIPQRRAGRRLLAGLGVVVVAGVAAGTVLVVRSGPGHSGGSVATSGAAMTVSAAPVNSLPVLAPIEPASAPSSSPSAGVSPSAAPNPSASAPAQVLATPAPGKPPARSASVAATPAASARPKCHMTTWVDDSGETHAKQVCE